LPPCGLPPGMRSIASCFLRSSPLYSPSPPRRRSSPFHSSSGFCFCCSRSAMVVSLVEILARFPVGNLALGLVLADAVGLLDLADQLVALPGDLVELVVGQLAPLLLDLAFGLLPVACDAVPVHLLSLAVVVAFAARSLAI